MKKKFMFVALVSLFSMGAFFTSCEEPIEDSCYCEFNVEVDGLKVEFGEGGWLTADYGVDNCKQLTALFMDDAEIEEDVSVECKAE